MPAAVADASADVPANLAAAARLRTLLSVAAGAAAGALQLRGARGALLYLATAAAGSAALAARAGGRPAACFRPETRAAVLVWGALDRAALLPFVVVWTLFDALSSPFA
jgi:hypothetical protein